MQTYNNEQERILNLLDVLMGKNIFIVKNFSKKMLATLCKCSVSKLESTIEDQTGFTSDDFIALYRVSYMRQLLFAGADYKTALKSSGFRSSGHLERVLNCIVI